MSYSFSGGGSALSDGDKGDIVVSSSGTVLSFDTGVVTAFAKTILDDPDAPTVRGTIGVGTVSTLASDTDITLTANSDVKVATQKAVKAYVDAVVTGVLALKGSTDCSANPNYPAASNGDAYYVSAAGKIGGASGKTVDVGDVFVANANNAGGTEASVGTSWLVLGHALAGVYSAGGNDVAITDGGTGSSTAAGAATNLGLGTGNSPQFAAVNIGHASDTTLTRVSAGVVAVEGDNVLMASTGQPKDATLTAWAAFNTNGVLCQTAADTFAGRTITGTANEITVTNGDGVSGAPTFSLPSAITLTGKTITGGSVTPAAAPTTTAIGYLGSPVTTHDATYTTVMGDAGGTLYHTSASAHTWTIASNASVAYPVGTVLTFINESGGGNVTIAITSDTLRWGSSTGSRTLAANGTASAIKVTSTVWRLTGDGIT